MLRLEGGKDCVGSGEEAGVHVPGGGLGDWGTWLHCTLRAKEFVMHQEVGGSRSVCDVGELGWRGRKGAVPGYEGISGDLHPPPPHPSPPTHRHSWVPGSAG